MPKLIHWSDLHVGRTPHEIQAVHRLVAWALAHHDPADEAIVITGDLVETPKGELYRALYKALLPLKDAGFEVFAVPGNHDIHPKGIDLGALSDATYAGWLGYVAKIIGQTSRRWPIVWHFKGWQIVGLDSNHGSRDDWSIDLARGEIGKDQLTEMTMLAQVPKTCVLLHHRANWKDSAHALKDGEALVKILDPRVPYVLCGHQHEAHEVQRGDTLYIAAPRTTERRSHTYKYQVLDLDTGERLWMSLDQEAANL